MELAFLGSMHLRLRAAGETSTTRPRPGTSCVVTTVKGVPALETVEVDGMEPLAITVPPSETISYNLEDSSQDPALTPSATTTPASSSKILPRGGTGEESGEARASGRGCQHVLAHLLKLQERNEMVFRCTIVEADDEPLACAGDPPIHRVVVRVDVLGSLSLWVTLEKSATSGRSASAAFVFSHIDCGAEGTVGDGSSTTVVMDAAKDARDAREDGPTAHGPVSTPTMVEGEASTTKRVDSMPQDSFATPPAPSAPMLAAAEPTTCHVVGCRVHVLARTEAESRRRFSLPSLFQSLPSHVEMPVVAGGSSQQRPPWDVGAQGWDVGGQGGQGCAATGASVGEAEGEKGLMAFPDDVLRIIFEMLPAEDLRMVELLSRKCRAIACDVVPGLNVRLHPHQQAALRWMLARERAPATLRHPLYKLLATGDGWRVFGNCVAGSMKVVYDGEPEPSVRDFRGGLFCDEPGLGKTVTGLALILKNKGKVALPPPGVQVHHCPAPASKRKRRREDAAVGPDESQDKGKGKGRAGARKQGGCVRDLAEWEGEEDAPRETLSFYFKPAGGPITSEHPVGSRVTRSRSLSFDSAVANASNSNGAVAGSSVTSTSCLGTGADVAAGSQCGPEEDSGACNGVPPLPGDAMPVDATVDTWPVDGGCGGDRKDSLGEGGQATPRSPVLVPKFGDASSAPIHRPCGPRPTLSPGAPASPTCLAAPGCSLARPACPMATAELHTASAPPGAVMGGCAVGATPADGMQAAAGDVCQRGSPDPKGVPVERRNDGSGADASSQGAAGLFPRMCAQGKEEAVAPGEVDQLSPSHGGGGGAKTKRRRTSRGDRSSSNNSAVAGSTIALTATAASPGGSISVGAWPMAVDQVQEERGAGGDGGGGADAAVWAQCEDCDKWRRLLPGAAPPTEKEPWFCWMNADTRHADCKVPEENADTELAFFSSLVPRTGTGSSSGAPPCLTWLSKLPPDALLWPQGQGLLVHKDARLPADYGANVFRHLGLVLATEEDPLEHKVEELLHQLADEAHLAADQSLPSPSFRQAPGAAALEPSPSSHAQRGRASPRRQPRDRSRAELKGAGPCSPATRPPDAHKGGGAARTPPRMRQKSKGAALTPPPCPTTSSPASPSGGPRSSSRAAVGLPPALLSPSSPASRMAQQHSWRMPGRLCQLQLDLPALRKALKGLPPYSGGLRGRLGSPSVGLGRAGAGSSPQGVSLTAGGRLASSSSAPIFLSAATLLLVPPTLMRHWEQQIRQHTRRGLLQVLVWDRDDVLAHVTPHEIAAHYDVVIASIHRLSVEWGKGHGSLLLRVHWQRVLVDEGHTLGTAAGISNKLSMACSLPAQCRWIMTGTPTPNTPSSHVAHLQPLLNFLGCEPYQQPSVFMEAIQRPMEKRNESGLARLRDVLQRCMICSRKRDLGSLPECRRQVRLLEFEREHAESYNELVGIVKRNLLLADWNDPDHVESLLNPRQSKRAKQLLNNVRLTCCLAGHIKTAIIREELTESLDILAGKGIPPERLDTLRDSFLSEDGCGCEHCGKKERLPLVTPCGHLLCVACVERNKEACGVCGAAYEMDVLRLPSADNPCPKVEPIPEEFIQLQPAFVQFSWNMTYMRYEPSKLVHLMQRLQEIGNHCCPDEARLAVESDQEGGGSPDLPVPPSCPVCPAAHGVADKSIVFSQFLEHLMFLSDKLKARGIRHANIFNPMNMERKREQLALFQSDGSCGVLLMDESGSLGLDLSFVTHVFLMEPIWDRSVEEQVVSRAYRMGALRPILVETLAMKGTAEESMLSLLAHAEEGADARSVKSDRELAELTSRNTVLLNLEYVTVAVDSSNQGAAHATSTPAATCPATTCDPQSGSGSLSPAAAPHDRPRAHAQGLFNGGWSGGPLPPAAWEHGGGGAVMGGLEASVDVGTVQVHHAGGDALAPCASVPFLALRRAAGRNTLMGMTAGEDMAVCHVSQPPGVVCPAEPGLPLHEHENVAAVMASVGRRLPKEEGDPIVATSLVSAASSSRGEVTCRKKVRFLLHGAG
eukprot:jgi/Mesvir1/23711/Mv18658-RA.2